MNTFYRTGFGRIDAVADTIDGGHFDTEFDAQPAPPRVTDWASRRKAQPVNVLLPATQRWLETLPEVVRPTTLAHKFPRIANRLAAAWSNPHESAACLRSLLVDERGGRKGFPGDVMDDLGDLREYLTQMNPLRDGVWSDASR